MVAWRHHATNLVLWGLLVFVVHGTLRRLVPGHAATAGALLFAVHPVHVEAVAWITGRHHIREMIPFPRLMNRLYP